MKKTPKLPPVKFFITGSDTELSIEEAKEHVRKLSKSRTANKINHKGA